MSESAVWAATTSSRPFNVDTGTLPNLACAGASSLPRSRLRARAGSRREQVAFPPRRRGHPQEAQPQEADRDPHPGVGEGQPGDHAQSDQARTDDAEGGDGDGGEEPAPLGPVIGSVPPAKRPPEQLAVEVEPIRRPPGYLRG